MEPNELDVWKPRTELGRLVKEGRITSIDEIFAQGLKIKEPQIIDLLLPGLEDEIVGVSVVQKQTDAGERTRFKALVAIGNKGGYVGLGTAKAAEIGPAIRKAVINAKMSITPVKLACGSWECGCGAPHTLPFKVYGKSGSVRMTLVPAPRGLGLVTADVAKIILRLAGVKDAWSFSRGHTKNTLNLAYATFNALKQTTKMLTPNDWGR
ncbi:MAG: 30S ribosomal protein S5 [Candidatus Jordarchaeales archaeon]|nr:30S ribosomal protein S5 [Candidatus Jordarchaeia archaeon]